MAIRLHGSARTTLRARSERQIATGLHRSLTKRCGINSKTVAKYQLTASNFRSGVTDTCIGHILECICKFNGLEKRHTKSYHPCTNGTVERMNRAIKESTIKAYEYEELEQLQEYIQAFVQIYNFRRRLKALKWKTPFRAMCEV